MLFVHNSLNLNPFEGIGRGKPSHGFRWEPTDDPNELEKRKKWDRVITSFRFMVNKFIKSRKGVGKKNFEAIAWYFMDHMYEMNISTDDAYFETAKYDIGWIRSSKIERDLRADIPNRTTFFRLLADMVDAEILQKLDIVEKNSRSSAKKTKASVYYRLLLHEPEVAHLQVMTYEELLPAAIAYYKGFRKYGELYLGAREYLKSEGHNDDGDDIDYFLLNNSPWWREYDEWDQYRIDLNIKLEGLLRTTLNQKPGGRDDVEWNLYTDGHIFNKKRLLKKTRK
jgi:hypothetical protein